MKFSIKATSPRSLPGAPCGDAHRTVKASLTKFSAVIKLTSNTGGQLEYKFASGKATPNKTVAEAIGEMARIAAVAGLQDEVRAAVDRSFKAVADWYAEQAAIAPSTPASKA